MGKHHFKKHTLRVIVEFCAVTILSLTLFLSLGFASQAYAEEDKTVNLEVRVSIECTPKTELEIDEFGNKRYFHWCTDRGILSVTTENIDGF